MRKTDLYVHVILSHPLQSLATNRVTNEWTEMYVSVLSIQRLKSTIMWHICLDAFICLILIYHSSFKQVWWRIQLNPNHHFLHRYNPLSNSKLCQIYSMLKVYCSNTTFICLVYNYDLSTASQIYPNSWKYMINKRKRVECSRLFTKGTHHIIQCIKRKLPEKLF